MKLSNIKLNLEINNIDKSPIRKNFIKKVIVSTLEESGYLELAEKKIVISVALVSESEIQRINKQYRKKNEATDILSFCEFEKIKQLKNVNEAELFLGELVLCYNYIKENAMSYVSEVGLQKELAKIIAHGVLHLLGFAHGKKMFLIQDDIALKSA